MKAATSGDAKAEPKTHACTHEQRPVQKTHDETNDANAREQDVLLIHTRKSTDTDFDTL